MWTAFIFELQNFKNERAWYNLNIPRDSIARLLHRTDWYVLYIPAAEMEFTRFDHVRRWEDIAIALLKKYCDRIYHHYRLKFEKDHLEYRELTESDKNFLQEYRLSIEQSAEAIIENLGKLKAMIGDGTFGKDWSFGQLEALCFGPHLYQPLLHFKSVLVEVTPVSLNDGEIEFVRDLRKFFNEKKEVLKGRELYLLRNMSRGAALAFLKPAIFIPILSSGCWRRGSSTSVLWIPRGCGIWRAWMIGKSVFLRRSRNWKINWQTRT